MRNAHQIKGMLKAFALASLVVGGTALASTRIPGTYTYYSASKDQITDINTGSVSIDELYDEGGDTFMIFRCANSGNPDLWAYMGSKNTLLSQADIDASTYPAVVMRLGTVAPITVQAASLTSVVDANQNVKPDRLAFSATMTRSMISGLLANKKLVVRVARTAGGAPLTYTFPAAGFATAWKAVNQCR